MYAPADAGGGWETDMDRYEEEKQARKKSNEMFNSITEKVKPENQKMMVHIMAESAYFCLVSLQFFIIIALKPQIVLLHLLLKGVHKVSCQIEAAYIGCHTGNGTGPYFIGFFRRVINVYRNAHKGGQAYDPQKDPGILTVQPAGLTDPVKA